MREKNNLNKLFLVLMLIILIIMLTSCTYYKEQEGEPGYKVNLSEEGEGVVITLNETEEGGVVIVLDKDKEVNVSGEELEEQEEQAEEKEEIPIRVSEVDFYFLLKGKSYFRHILKENQRKIYNMSGYLVTIEPIIITRDSVKFRINNYTTKALQEDDSDSTPEFEIIVSNIYYRP